MFTAYLIIIILSMKNLKNLGSVLSNTEQKTIMGGNTTGTGTSGSTGGSLGGGTSGGVNTPPEDLLTDLP